MTDVLKVGGCAGHAGFGKTPGKRTPDGEYEWDFNNKVIRAFEKELLTYANVEFKRFDDRTGKTDVSLDDRVKRANIYGADCYISFHANASQGVWGNWTGTETFVMSGAQPGSRALASVVHPTVVKAMGLEDRGIRTAEYYVLKFTKMPAILIETGFMDSVIDIKKLRDDKVLANVGKQVAIAVAKHYKLKKKPVVKPVVKPAVKPVVKPTVKPATKSYKVKDGDTLWSISNKTKISIEKIKEYNGMKSDTLMIGKILKLEKPSSKVYHKVVKGDTLWELSVKYKVSVEAIKKRNGLKSDMLTVGKKLLIK